MNYSLCLSQQIMLLIFAFQFPLKPRNGVQIEQAKDIPGSSDIEYHSV